ncbi:prevent-host-death protein [Nostoc piscinale]|uniref:prevent-host-death protein n=1 Tax=Nostoc piscinale TaxID=224012 RepID=UPI000AE3EED2|nr:prevent-host-death protein [Nostoc piscinale]
MKKPKNSSTSIIYATSREPQLIYTQEQLVAAIVDPELFEEFLTWRQKNQQNSLAQVFQELQQLCIEEDYSL